MRNGRSIGWRVRATAAGLLAAVVVTIAPLVHAIGSSDNPQSGSVGLQGTISSAPPTQAATIAIPTNGQVVTKIPITVSGLCPNNLLVKLFTNNVFVGSTLCVNGSYSLQIDLFDGLNDLVARVFDALDQPGPDSNTVAVTFQDNQFAGSGTQLLALTSAYARRGANPGQTLSWPIILSGGAAPYALSVTWGDGKAADLLSESFAGTINLDHIYDTAGVYNVVIKATDKNGETAFLQLVAIANGAVQASTSTTSSGSSATLTKTKVLWAPSAALVAFIVAGFWLGRKYQLAALRKNLGGE